MLTLNGAARTFVIWLTLCFAWSAIVLWQFGPDIVKTIMSHSHLYAWDLATRMVQGDIMPPGRYHAAAGSAGHDCRLRAFRAHAGLLESVYLHLCYPRHGRRLAAAPGGTYPYPPRPSR
ncbi:hypothetical protein LDO48_23405 [Pantoea agglomerans]|nr:hypothetical protein [Pantoea agglomerans]